MFYGTTKICISYRRLKTFIDNFFSLKKLLFFVISKKLKNDFGVTRLESDNNDMNLSKIVP